jgi:YesN/AraC family two-component response regulator
MISAKELKELSKNQNLLFVEDEEIIREQMQSVLSKFFQNTFVAKDGLEALEIYKKENIDIVLTDINMPRMNGLELIREINKLTPNAIIIVLSAHGEAEMLFELINLDASGFINKPPKMDILIKTLFRNCSIVSDRRLLDIYAKTLEEENAAMIRKNLILERKLNELASMTNKCDQIESQSSEDDTTEEKKEKPKEEKPKEKKPKKKEKASEADKYFHSLLQEDKDELEDITDELDSAIVSMFNNDEFSKYDMVKISELYHKYSSVLNGYPEFYDFANILTEFANKIVVFEEKFLEDLDQTGFYFESLQVTIDTFRNNVWVKGEKDPRFYNNSLKSDVQAVLDFLEDKQDECDEDDIEFFI